jgi:hypothetical protein
MSDDTRKERKLLRPLPANGAARKRIPIVTGLLDYFPAALAAVAEVSVKGNEKHNPGQPLHHSRGKSNDHADAAGRHLMERGSIDPDTGCRHSAELAWRALALLQEELEQAGEAPLARGAFSPAVPPTPPTGISSTFPDPEAGSKGDELLRAVERRIAEAERACAASAGQLYYWGQASEAPGAKLRPSGGGGLLSDMEAEHRADEEEDRRDWLRDLLGREPSKQDLDAAFGTWRR